MAEKLFFTTSNVFLTKKGQNGHKENFSRHKTTVKWFKAIVPSFRPSYIWNSDAPFQRKWLKTWFLGQNGQFLDQKKGPKLAKNFFDKILNCFIHYETINLVLKTKISKITSTDRKKMAENLIFHHKQCIFDQKVNFQIFPGENYFAIF